jgi:hypothetical protein
MASSLSDKARFGLPERRYHLLSLSVEGAKASSLMLTCVLNVSMVALTLAVVTKGEEAPQRTAAACATIVLVSNFRSIISVRVVCMVVSLVSIHSSIPSARVSTFLTVVFIFV